MKPSRLRMKLLLRENYAVALNGARGMDGLVAIDDVALEFPCSGVSSSTKATVCRECEGPLKRMSPIGMALGSDLNT
jgi:hypothetical protein